MSGNARDDRVGAPGIPSRIEAVGQGGKKTYVYPIASRSALLRGMPDRSRPRC